MTLTDTQQRVLRQLREGWTARQGFAKWGAGLDGHGQVRLTPPGQGAVDYARAQTLRALEAAGLVREVREDAQRTWELTAQGWEG